MRSAATLSAAVIKLENTANCFCFIKTYKNCTKPTYYEKYLHSLINFMHIVSKGGEIKPKYVFGSILFM